MEKEWFDWYGQKRFEFVGLSSYTVVYDAAYVTKTIRHLEVVPLVGSVDDALNSVEYPIGARIVIHEVRLSTEEEIFLAGELAYWRVKASLLNLELKRAKGEVTQ